MRTWERKKKEIIHRRVDQTLLQHFSSFIDIKTSETLRFAFFVQKLFLNTQTPIYITDQKLKLQYTF